MAISKVQAIYAQALAQTSEDINKRISDKLFDAKTGNGILADIGSTILTSGKLIDSFMNSLVDVIYKATISSKSYKNPWAHCKKGTIEYGVGIEDIYIDFLEPQAYSAKSSLLESGIPDNIRAIFYTINAYNVFKTGINYQTLQQAFTSNAEMANFTQSVINRLYDSAEKFEWEQLQDLMGYDFLKCVGGNPAKADLYTGSGATCRQMYFDDGDTEDAKNFASINLAKKLRGLALNMNCLSTKYNNYSGYVKAVENQSLPAWQKLSKKPLSNKTDYSDMYLYMLNDYIAEIDIDVLSVAFHMDKAEFMGHVFGTPSFGTFQQTSEEENPGVTKGQWVDDDGELHETTRQHRALDEDVQTIPEGQETKTITITSYDKGQYIQAEGDGNYEYKLVGMMMDGRHMGIWDDRIPAAETFYDPSTQITSIFMHKRQCFALSPVHNCVAIYTRHKVE